MLKLIAVVGPTASGKTGLGVKLAKMLNGEVISVDSRQIYRQMTIGTAKVTTDETEGVPHWGIDIVDPDYDFSVAEFKEYAEKKINEIAARGHTPILVGGTGLWLRALIDNYDLGNTPSDPVLRAELEGRELEDLFDEYKRLDPEGAEVIDSENKRRVVRALEVTKLTHKSFSSQQTKSEQKYNVLQIGISVDRKELYERINKRVDQMIKDGLVEEVRALNDKYGCDIYSMSGIGYRQICGFLNGNITLEQAIEDIKKATRLYAKRQMTWFKRDNRINWVTSAQEAIELVRLKFDQ